MVWFIIGLILLVGAAIALVVAINAKRDGEDEYFGLFSKIAGGVALVGLILASFSTIYTQDESEMNVIRSISGEVQKTDITPGFGIKAPWDKKVTFDTLNNVVELEVPFNDKDGARGTMRLAVIHNLEANEEIGAKLYKAYRSQGTMEERLISQDVRSVLNKIPSKYSTTQIRTERGQLEQEMQSALTERWADWGLNSVQINILDDGYPAEIIDRYNSLVAERTKAEEAKAATVTAQEKAKQQVVEAKAKAEANNLLEKSLTPQVLRNNELETLKAIGEKGNMIITDGSSGTLLNVDTKKSE